MNRRRERNAAVAEGLERLDAGLAALSEAAGAGRASPAAFRRIDAGLRALVDRAGTLSRDLDPVRWPRFVFDPGDPATVGRFIALATVAQPRAPLPAVERFHGSGVYALYYRGGFVPYAPIRGAETPIYVGKADPASDTARTPVDQGSRLHDRLRDRPRNIGKTKGTLDPADFDCRFLVVQTGWQGAAEDYLIDLFRPVWNNETDICFGLGKHGDAPSTRSNRRSPWDTLHPGRDWASRDPKMVDARPRARILADLAEHFSAATIYRDLDRLLKDFIDEPRQL